MILCRIQTESHSPFLITGYVLNVLLNFGHFSASLNKRRVCIHIGIEKGQSFENMLRIQESDRAHLFRSDSLSLCSYTYFLALRESSIFE